MRYWLFVVLSATIGCEPPSRSSPIPDSVSPVRALHEVYRMNAGPVVIEPTNEPSQIVKAVEIPNPSTADSLALRLYGTSCGCASVNITPELVPPGSSAAVTMTMNLPMMTGELRATASLGTNLTKPSQVMVELVTYIVPRLAVDYEGPDAESAVFPGRSASKRVIVRAACESRTKSIANKISAATSVGKVVAVGDPVQDSPVDGIRRWSQEFDVTIECPLNPTGDVMTQTVYFTHGNRRVKRDIVWSVQQWISIVPPRPFLQVKDDHAQAIIQLEGDRPFAIEGVETTTPLLRTEHREGLSAANHEIKLLVEGLPPKGFTARELLVVRTTHAHHQRVEIPVAVLWTKLLHKPR